MTESYSYPILIYDNLCYSCSKMSKLVNYLIQNKCLVVGHYTQVGKQIKERLFPKDYDGLDMSWFVIDGYAYGGRAGLLRLLRYLLFDRKKNSYLKNEFNLMECSADCKTVKGVFLRSYSVVTKYKKFRVPSVEIHKQ